MNKTVTRTAIAVAAALSLALGAPRSGPAAQDPQPKGNDLHGLAQKVWDGFLSREHPAGGGGVSSLVEVEIRVIWSKRLAETSVAAGTQPKVAWRAHADRMKAELVASEELHQAGRQSAADVALFQFFVTEAETILRALDKK